MVSTDFRKTFVYAFFVVVALALAFVGFHLLYNASISEYAKEFVAGCLGALITIAATAALLKSQTDGEVIREQLANMFQLKLAMYSDFILHLNKTHADDKLTSKELDSIIDWAIKLSLVASPEMIEALNAYLFQLIAFDAFEYSDLEGEKHDEWLRFRRLKYDDINAETDNLDLFFVSYGELIYRLRIDLLNRAVANHDQHFDTRERIDQIRHLRGVVSVRVSEENGIEYRYA